MAMPMHWLGSCQTAAAAPKPLQPQQQHAMHSTATSSTSSRAAVSHSHRSATAAAAANASASSSGCHARAVAASAAAAAAGAFPLPEPTSFYNPNSSSSSSRGDSCGTATAPSASAAAAVDALTGMPPQGWQLSSHIRQSVEEAMKASMCGMPFVQVPQQQHQQQAQEQEQVQPEREQLEQEQQQHPSWQRLVLDLNQVVEVQHTKAAPSTAAAAVGNSDSTSSSSSSNSSSSSGTLLTKSTQQIKACKSAADLEQLLCHSWQHMDPVHVSAAFVQLARMQQQRPAQAQAQAQEQPARGSGNGRLSEGGWSLLQQAAQRQLHTLQSRQCSNILWACASAGLKPSQPLLQGLLARTQTLLQQGMTPQGFANTLWALASLRVQPSSQWLQDFFTASQQQLCNFQPQELSSTIWALAQLRQQPPGEWYAAFLAASAAKLGVASAQSLSNQLWGVARLGLVVPDHWWCALTYACSVRAAELTPSGVCQVLWGAGMVAGKQQRRKQQQQERLQRQRRGSKAAQPLQPEWGYITAQEPAAAEQAAAASSSSGGDTQWLEPLLAAVQPHLQQLDSTAASSLLWSLAVLGHNHNPGPAFVNSCLACMSAQGALSASSAAHALWAASRHLGPDGGVGLSELLPLVQRLQQHGMQGCKPQEFVYVAAALASLRKQQQQQPACAAAGDAVSGTQQQGPTGTAPHQQQQLLPALPELPSPAALHAAAAASGSTVPAEEPLHSLAQHLLDASRHQLQHFHLGQLCQLARWVAAAEVQPDAAWVGSFLAATTPHLHMLQEGQQLLLLHAVQHWGVGQAHQGWAALFLNSCTSELALRGYSAAHVGTLLQAFAAAKLQPQPHHAQQLLQRVLHPDAQLDAAAMAAVLGGLFSLGFRPPDGWQQQLWAAGAAAVLRATPEGLTAVAGVLQHKGIWRLSMQPNRPFAAALHAATAAALPQLQPQQAAAMLAALTAAHMQPKGGQEQLLPGLMSVAVRGLYNMPLQDVIAAWWGLVRPKVLSCAVPLEQLAAAPQQQQQQQQQDQQWLQQQWQALWLRRLLSSSAAQLAELPPASLLQLADCLRRLQQPVPSGWADAYIMAVSPHLPKLVSHELHVLLHALPCFGGAAALPGFAVGLMAAAGPQLADFTPTQLSDSLYSIQQAGLKPPEPWLKDYVSAAAGCLPQFWPRQLTRVLTALARLRFMPDAGFLSAATSAAVEHLPKYRVDPGEMVDLLWAVVALRVRPSAAWMAKFEARLLERGPEQLDGRQLSRLGWCLSALQRKPGRVLWAKWLAATEQQMPRMDGSSLADTLWTCAMLDEQPSHTWLDTFSSSSLQHLDTLSSSSLVTVVWSLALLQHRAPTDWMLSCLAALSRSFCPTSSQQQQQYGHAEPLSPGQVIRVSWALAALDCQLPAAFSAQLLQECVSQAPQLDADSLAQLVWAWDRLDSSHDKQAVRQVAAAARSQLMPYMHDAVMGTSGAGVAGGMQAGLLHPPGSVLHPGPSARARLGQQQVVLRPSGTGSGSGSGSSRVWVAPQQQQVVAVAPRGVLQEGGVLASGQHGFSGFTPQWGVFGPGGRRLKLGTKQQLMATLHKLHSTESSSGSGSSGGSSSADAHMSAAV